MKKKLILTISIVIVFALTVFIALQNDDKVIYESGVHSIKTSDALALMYETESGSGEYQVSTDTSWPQEGYVFNAELSRCENGSKLYWDEETKSVMMEANTSDKCYVYFDKKTLGNAAEYIASLYTTDGDNGLYYHDADLANGVQDNSYRFSGATPNNYVCFGATGPDCQNEDNQYRIIGVFNNQVKLIKSTSYGDYAWDADSNTWDATTKPDIYTTLNETYYNTLGSEWQNIIAESTWQVGGMALNTANTAKQYYDVEVGTGQSGYEETMKIGLMYVSDYGYGANPEKWTTALGYPDGKNYGTDNWLYLGADEWLISRNTSNAYDAFRVYSNYGGFVGNDFVNNARAVRPSFYLESSVEFSGGNGSSADPYKVA